MTLFDVRLGWWIANPAGKRWQHGSPAIGFYWLLRELLGATNDESNYVYRPTADTLKTRHSTNECAAVVR
jgi:hypothetical protein